MRVRKVLFVLPLLLLSACASIPAKKNIPSNLIAGDYEVISYETIECGLYGPMPMTGEAHFGDDGHYRIRMDVKWNWIDAPSDSHPLELNGSFYAWPNNEILLYEQDTENAKWVNDIKKYRIEDRPDGKYLILITQLPKEDVRYMLSLLKGRHDKEAQVLTKKYREGFEWTFKKK